MLVSAIVSTYNAQRFIRGRLENLLAQTLYRQGQLEIIVIDSASQENEGGIVQEFQERYKNLFYLRTDLRETVYGAWNQGLAMAKGRYFINANSDDRFVEDGLELLAKKLENTAQFDAVYGDWYYTSVENDKVGSSIPKIIFKYPDFNPALLFYQQVTSHALMIRRESFCRIGTFNSVLQVFGDREWVFRFAAKGRQAAHIQVPVGLYLRRDDSLERANRDQGNREFNALLVRYQKPKDFAALHGYRDVPERKVLAQLYALTGALGIFFISADSDNVVKIPPQSLVFFRRALSLDPDNIIAANDLAIVAASQGGEKFAKDSLVRLIALSDGGKKVDLIENLKLVESGTKGLASFRWFVRDN